MRWISRSSNEIRIVGDFKMFVYIVFIFLLFTLYAVHLKEEQGGAILMFLLFLLMAFRSWNMGLNDTMGNYCTFLTFQHRPLSYAFNNPYYPIEPLMSFIMWFFANIVHSFYLFIFFCSGFSMYSVWRFIKSKSCEMYMSISIFFCMYYFFAFFLIKQWLAIGVVLCAYSYFEEKKYIKWIIAIIIAILIHKFAFVMIFSIVGYLLIKRTKYSWIVSIIALAIALLTPQWLLEFIIKYDPTNLIGLYMRSNLYTMSGGRLNFTIFYYFMLVIVGYYMRKNIPIEELDKYNSVMGMIINASVFSALSSFIPEFYRIALFFGIFSIVYIPILFRYTNNGILKKVLVISFILFLLFYGMGRLAVNINCIPYKTFFTDKVL